MDFATLRLQPFNSPLFLTSSFPVVALVNKDREILQLLPVSSCSFSFLGWHLCFFCSTGKSFPPYQIFIPIFLQPLSRDFPRGTKSPETIPEGKAESFPSLQNFKPRPNKGFSSSSLNFPPVVESLTLHLLSLGPQLGISNKLQPPESLPGTRNCILLGGYIEKCLINSLQNKPGWWVSNSLPAKQCGLKYIYIIPCS